MDRGDHESGELSGHVEFQQHWGAQLIRTKTSPKVGEPDDPDHLFVGFSIKSPFSATVSPPTQHAKEAPGFSVRQRRKMLSRSPFPGRDTHGQPGAYFQGWEYKAVACERGEGRKERAKPLVPCPRARSWGRSVGRLAGRRSCKEINGAYVGINV